MTRFSLGKIGYNGQEPKYHQVGLAGDYHLSKFTEVYVFGAFQRAAGSALYADIYDGAVGSGSTTNKQVFMRLGIVHKF
jgi:predicted porin